MAAFLVNHGGRTVDVDEAAAERLLADGFRVATDAEVAAWYAEQGLNPDGTPVAVKAEPRAKAKG